MKLSRGNLIQELPCWLPGGFSNNTPKPGLGKRATDRDENQPDTQFRKTSSTPPDHPRRLAFPTQFCRQLPGHVTFTTLHRYYSAVRLLTEHHSPLRFRL
jgi:hypothetical protein